MVLSRSLLWTACAAVVLAGCGGSVSPVSTGGGDTGGTREAVGTAKFRVDLGSGSVVVTQLDNAGGRALFTGNAVGVTSSRVLNDLGELTVRGIEVTLTNNTERVIGANGFFRVVLSDFANLGGLSTDYSGDTFVSTPASPSRPYGVDTDSDGSVYFSGKTSGQIHKMVGGEAAQLASGFNGPAGVAVIPGTDFLAVAENGGNLISVTSLTSGGRTVIAGTGATGSADGPGASATFSSPDGVTVDSLGNIYVADAGTSRIRMISNPLGTPVVSTLVSSGLTTIADIDAVLIQGTEYLVVASKHAVYGVALPGGQVFSIAGSQTSSGNVNGAGVTARFKLVRGVDAVNGAIFVMDSQNYSVKQITLDSGGNPLDSASWHVALLAGDGVNAHSDGAGNVARFQYSQHLAASPSGRLYVASYSGDFIRLVESTSSVLPFLGSTGSGSVEPVKVSNATSYYSDQADFRPYFAYSPQGGIAPNSSYKLTQWDFLIPEDVAAFEFVMAVESDTTSAAALDAVFTTGSDRSGSEDVFTRMIAGSPDSVGHADGPGQSASFNYPYGLAAAADGTVFATDINNNCVRMITPAREVHTIAGFPNRWGTPTNTSGDLVAFSGVLGVATNDEGTVLYVTDYFAHLVIRISLRDSYLDRTDASNWDVRVIAGTGTSGYTNGYGSTAEFFQPAGIAVGADDTTVYVCDSGYHKVRKLSMSGGDPNIANNWQVTLLAGADFIGSADGYVDGGPFTARFMQPWAITIGPTGMIYVADLGNFAVRAITPQGNVTTLAGNGSTGYVDSATGADARFGSINAIDADDAGYLYLLDQSYSAIRRISTATGESRTVAGGGSGAYIDGLGSEFSNTSILAVCVEPSGSAVVSTG
jgi:sugar lactone lactonase YvrE